MPGRRRSSFTVTRSIKTAERRWAAPPWRWPTSSVSTEMPTRRCAAAICPRRRVECWTTSSTAEPPSLAATYFVATNADMRTSPTTHAGIVIVPSARPQRGSNGWLNAKRNCYPCSTFMSSSRSQRKSGSPAPLVEGSRAFSRLSPGGVEGRAGREWAFWGVQGLIRGQRELRGPSCSPVEARLGERCGVFTARRPDPPRESGSSRAYPVIRGRSGVLSFH